jgi:hypothetical protein
MARAKGVPLRYNEQEMLLKLKENIIPTQMKHCVIAVEPKMQGTPHERYLSAFNICAAVFEKNGYQVPKTMKLTGKGLRNNMQHRREPDNSFKNSRFDFMTKRLWQGHINRIQESIERGREKLRQQQSQKQGTSAQPNVANQQNRSDTRVIGVANTSEKGDTTKS